MVHVAAWDSYFGGLEDADFATWQSVIDVNLLGTLRIDPACLPALKVCGGSVVMIEDAVVGGRAEPGAAGGVRGPAQGALTSAMYSLARELRARIASV